MVRGNRHAEVTRGDPWWARMSREKSAANLAGRPSIVRGTATGPGAPARHACGCGHGHRRHAGCCNSASTFNKGAAMKKQSGRPARDPRQAAASASRMLRKGKPDRHGRPAAPAMPQGLVPESQDEAVYEQRKEAS
jgi:hypothetical protein